MQYQVHFKQKNGEKMEELINYLRKTFDES